MSEATYLPSGPLASLTLGNGLTETRDYFADRPLAQLTDNGTTQSWQLWS